MTMRPRPHTQAILDSLLEERGELSLEHLRALPCDDIKAQLGRYKGVGPKSIACAWLAGCA
jgi:endonuclease-3